jgi:hypothetical protein
MSGAPAPRSPKPSLAWMQAKGWYVGPEVSASTSGNGPGATASGPPSAVHPFDQVV